MQVRGSPQDILVHTEKLDRCVEATTLALGQVIEPLAQELGAEGSGQGYLIEEAESNSETFASEVLLVRQLLQGLEKLLEESDLTALERFAEIRDKLGCLTEVDLNALEGALQNLEMEEAHRVCLDILANLSAVH